jgi:hypothetical protein
MSMKFLTTLALLSVFAAGGCTGDRLGGDLRFPWQEEKKKEEPRPVFSMGGRWMLTSPNRGQCYMNMTGAPRATEGTIAPEGGCPGRFFTSRKWSLGEEGKIKIEDHNGQELAQLTPSGTGGALWFEGQAATGERVMLARQ